MLVWQTYLDVTAEVSDWLISSILQVEVCPAQQQLLWGQLHQVCQGLPFSQQRCQRCGGAAKTVKLPEHSSLAATWTRRRTFVPAELDVSKQPDLDDLPQEAEHQVRLPLHQV